MTSPQLNEQVSRADRLIDLIAPKLQLVEEELRRNFQSKIQTIHDVGEHILGGGGKRLRPALLLLVSKMLRYEGHRDVVYGAVIEFIHTATLVHDDIIDEAAIRRGRTSINYRWGNNLTVLVGDYLYMHSMNLALAEGNLDVLRLLSNVTIRHDRGRGPGAGAERPRRSDDRRLLRDRRPQDGRPLWCVLSHSGVPGRSARESPPPSSVMASTSASASSSSTTCSTSPRAPRSSASRRCRI